MKRDLVDYGFVVFDNNAYKALGGARLDRIIGAERVKGVTPLANVVVTQELLARVRDADPEQRARNRAAIKKLGRHCKREAHDQVRVRFLTHTDGHIHLLVSGEQHTDDAALFDRLGQMIGVVTEAPEGDPLDEIWVDLDEIERTVRHVEAIYVGRLEASSRETAEPNEMKRALNYAATIAGRAQALYRRRFADEAVVQSILPVAKATEIAFALHDAVVAEIRTNGGHAKHANTVWDEEVVSSTSIHTTIRGRSLLLVTEENRLLDAARVAKAQDRVCKLATYEESLGLDPW